MKNPEISILVPTLNERQQLPELFADLSRQTDVACELLICDGGSTDGTLEWLQQQAGGPLPIRRLQSLAGRGRQLNTAAEQAAGKWLLFLHADSRFADSLALRKALNCLQQTANIKVAGHFALKFRRNSKEPSVGYYYYEWKARLGRPETIHGDQGFLLHRDFWSKVGPFREDLPVMEDTDFAERLRQQGQWRLLPAEISTSARRFEQEGLWQRQLLNSLIMCFRSIGWVDYFQGAAQVYRLQQGQALRVYPFFQAVRQQMNGLSCRQRWQIWHAAGGYVRDHAWQLTSALDARRAFRNKIPVEGVNPVITKAFEPVYDLLTDNRIGRLLATGLLRIWFEATSLWLRCKEKSK